MGWLSKHNNNGGRKGGNRSNKHKYPLRKVVGRKIAEEKDSNYKVVGLEYELLECGHLGRAIISINTSVFGTQSANSRRCKQCYDEQK
jgi:hypothetical protein